MTWKPVRPRAETQSEGGPPHGKRKKGQGDEKADDGHGLVYSPTERGSNNSEDEGEPEMDEGFLEGILDGSEMAEEPHKAKVNTEDEAPKEERRPKLRTSPCRPCAEDVAAHNATHCPERNWCPVCVRAFGREEPHKREAGKGKQEGIPKVGFDYAELDKDEDNTALKVIVGKDEQTGNIISQKILLKGPTDEWVVKRTVQELKEFGHRDIVLKTDGEPALVAVQDKIQSMREGKTVPENPPVYDPQSNGACEKGVQDLTGQVRVLKLALEQRLGCKIKSTDKIMEWMIPHAAFIINKFQVGHDGMTPCERLTGRKWKAFVTEFGEKVLAKLVGRKPVKVKGKMKRQKRKLQERSIEGIFVGVIARTGENIIIDKHGDALRCRTIRRVPAEDQWNREMIMSIKGTPRVPAPSRKRPEAIEARLVDEAAEEAPGEARAPRRARELTESERLPETRVRDADIDMRRFRIGDRLLDKYGYTEGCHACDAKLRGEVARGGHTEPCRARIMEQMREDEEEVALLERDRKKMEEKDKIKQRRTDGAKDEYKGEPNTQPCQGGAEQPLREETVDETPADDYSIGIPEAAEESDDEPQPLEQSDDDEPMETAIDEADQADSEEEDSDAEQDRASKRQRVHRLNYAAKRAMANPVTSIGRAMAGVLEAEETPKQVLCKVQEILKENNIKRVIDELEKVIQLKMPKDKPKQVNVPCDTGMDVAEIYSPPRITKAAKEMGLDAGWALDLTEVDPTDGLPWDFSDAKKRSKAKEMLNKDKPLVLIASPMCGPFSSLQQWNYHGKTKKEIEGTLAPALEHLKFTMEMCLEQYRAGRLFVFEHPVSATSWYTRIIDQIKALEGVMLAKFDFCVLGMTTVSKDGEEVAAKKRTGILTNSKAIADLLRLAQCRGEHKHQQLLDGKAGPCQTYPEKFCRVICEGIKREINNVKWREEMGKCLDVTSAFGRLMALQLKSEEMAVPPEEDHMQDFEDLYEGMEFIDDVSGLPLDREEAIKARIKELEYFKTMGVYTKVQWTKGMKVISVKWLDVNKGDEANKNYRARLVGREIKRNKRDDLFAATPPLESLRMILSVCASNQYAQNDADNFVVMSIDVKRAYFYAPTTRPIYIRIPDEDHEEGDEHRVGLLNLSLYGTRDAAMNWASTYTKFLESHGFKTGHGSPCNFCHEERGISMTVHGDDFTATGSEYQMKWLETRMKEKFEVKSEMLGPSKDRHQQEIRVLNRVLTWTDAGITYEADQRHAEIAISELGLEQAKAVATPGTREDALKATAVGGEEHNSKELNKEDAKRFRGLAARLNYLSQDRADIQYAVKEVSRRMSKPREQDWGIMKRIARYLIGAPRAVYTFKWQAMPKFLDTYVDSDWAGCKGSCRSTNGGVSKLGGHAVKSWSTTQALVALSSGEAELYSMTKGASMTLGLMTLAQDLGVILNGKIHSDASAAIGIVRRQGLGKLRHVNVRYLWLQDKLKDGELEVLKVPGAENPADAMTKHLAQQDLRRHMRHIGMELRDDRASKTPQLQAVSETKRDEWGVSRDEAVRQHKKPRRELFTPLRVQGAPPVRTLTGCRITTGRFCDNGEKFKIVDSWTTRSGAHRDLERWWTGQTVFFVKSAVDQYPLGPSPLSKQ